MKKQTLLMWCFGFLALAAGALVNVLGDRLLGVQLEFFYGVKTFSPLWILDVFLVPFFAGLVVAMIYGLGGKILCYFAPLIVRVFEYVYIVYFAGVPEGAILLDFWLWILVVILAVESAAIGGVIGEIVLKRTYGRRPRHMVYKENP